MRSRKIKPIHPSFYHKAVSIPAQRGVCLHLLVQSHSSDCIVVAVQELAGQDGGLREQRYTSIKRGNESCNTIQSQLDPQVHCTRHIRQGRRGCFRRIGSSMPASTPRVKMYEAVDSKYMQYAPRTLHTVHAQPPRATGGSMQSSKHTTQLSTGSVLLSAWVSVIMCSTGMGDIGGAVWISLVSSVLGVAGRTNVRTGAAGS